MQRLLANRGDPPGMETLRQRYAHIPVERIRCFSIIAHIDHGKSTLADKLLESTRNIFPTSRGHQQVLDSLEVERSRGITVKAQSASMVYRYKRPGVDDEEQEYLINLIDTPGHVDFSYEVARSLAACQGALLLIDASQGVQAQTVANFNSAKEAGLSIIPVLTKIDLPAADPEPCLNALEGVLGLDQDTALWTSAKSGEGVAEVLPAIIDRIPPPGDTSLRAKPLRCLLFDSWYDPFRGVVCAVLVVEGVMRPGDTIVAAHSGDKFTVQELGLMAPAKMSVGTVSGGAHQFVEAPASAGASATASAGGGGGGASGSVRVPQGALGAGHIGYMIAGMRSTKQAQVGDTFFNALTPVPPLAGFRPAKPMVFASLYPVDSGDFQALVTAVDRLTLNDASVTVERESSTSLGFGLRCGFLGLLHMDVFHQRLQQEFATPVIITAPMVQYRLVLHSGKTVECERPGDFPPPHDVAEYHEPTVHVAITTPGAFVSALMTLLADRRGVQEDIIYITGGATGSSAAAAVTASIATAPQATAAAAGGDGTGGGVDVDDIDAAAAALEAAGDPDHDADDDYDEDDDEEEDDASSSSSSSRSKSSSSSRSSSSASALASSVDLGDRVVLKYQLPWAEVVTDLNDAIKSLTAGYASLDWAPGAYQRSPIVKVDVLVNSKPVDALCFVAHRDKAVSEGRRVAGKLRKAIARQQFEVVIQAAIGGKVFAKERIPPFRKDVLSRNGKVMGGGDITRKQKLLSKQREGKKRMKTVGNVALSQEAFHSIMSKD